MQSPPFFYAVIFFALLGCAASAPPPTEVPTAPVTVVDLSLPPVETTHAAKPQAAKAASVAPKEQETKPSNLVEDDNETTTPPSGIIGILKSGSSTPNGSQSPFGNDAALGNLMGGDVGDSFGTGGLGLRGLGPGGGGTGQGVVGLGKIGSFGHGSGYGTGYGSGTGGLVRPTGSIGTGNIDIQGRLPPELIRRIVRQSINPFRVCYEYGLKNNPQLKGKIVVRFVIANDGSVESATASPLTDLHAKEVVTCVLSRFKSLRFPKPEGGKVSVVYPLLFQPNDEPQSSSPPLGAGGGISKGTPAPPATKPAETPKAAKPQSP